MYVLTFLWRLNFENLERFEIAIFFTKIDKNGNVEIVVDISGLFGHLLHYLACVVSQICVISVNSAVTFNSIGLFTHESKDIDNHRASVQYLEIMDAAKPSLLFK